MARICGNHRPLFLLRVPFGRTAPFRSRKYAPLLAGVRHCRLADRLRAFSNISTFRPLIAQYAGKGGAIDILMPLGLSYYASSRSPILFTASAPRTPRVSLARAAAAYEFPHRYLRPDYPRRR